MFRRFHEKLQEKEGGFTLIELLVVILIIAILAAIAIPVFLSQREKGWVAQSESALKNAATALESYATANNGDYSGADLAALATEGYNDVAGVTLVLTTLTTSAYCVDATHVQGIDPMFYSSDTGIPDVGSC